MSSIPNFRKMYLNKALKREKLAWLLLILLVFLMILMGYIESRTERRAGINHEVELSQQMKGVKDDSHSK